MSALDTSRNEGLPIGLYDNDDDLLAAAQPRVRISRPSRIEVVLGSGSRPHLELNIQDCLADQVPLTRRAGGGCSVVLDPGNLVVSVVLPAEGLPGIRSSFNALSSWMIAGLVACGLPNVQQRGTSDLTIDDRKIGGSCIYKPRAVFYYSTTLLVDADSTAGPLSQTPATRAGLSRTTTHAEFVLELRQRGGVAIEAPQARLQDVLTIPSLP
ncbi:MAG: hypothetical protein U0V87_02490 [Acidobacteriota bacterium]